MNNLNPNIIVFVLWFLVTGWLVGTFFGSGVLGLMIGFWIGLTVVCYETFLKTKPRKF